MRNGALHRIREVRLCQGRSLRCLSRQMKVSVGTLKKQEAETSDLLLSQLYAWQDVLDVPLSELLVDTGDGLSPIVQQRARMIKVMKTAATIAEKANAGMIGRLADNLMNQLREMMPTLESVRPWHEVGQRRRPDEYGRAVERSLPDELFGHHWD